jgi:hypothetical protein
MPVAQEIAPDFDRLARDAFYREAPAAYAWINIFDKEAGTRRIVRSHFRRA